MPRNKRDPVIVALVAVLLVFLFSEIHHKCPKPQSNHTIKYWPHGDNLKSVKNVFDRLGHEMVNGSDEWEVLWSDGNPFEAFPDEMKNLEAHQRVNHFPGMNLLTNAAVMTSNSFFPFIPATFEFPRMIEEFENFVEMNPEVKFVRKGEKNRQVEIVTRDEINFEENPGVVYQEFKENLLLIDGHAFELGVYVLVTSLEPLRVYRYVGLQFGLELCD
jgi:tubulin monoglycylase TTLL15